MCLPMSPNLRLRCCRLSFSPRPILLFTAATAALSAMDCIDLEQARNHTPVSNNDVPFITKPRKKLQRPRQENCLFSYVRQQRSGHTRRSPRGDRNRHRSQSRPCSRKSASTGSVVGIRITKLLCED
jgi:hypothetical protein